MSTSLDGGEPAPDLAEIALWAAWVSALMRHAGEQASDPSDRWVLEGAAGDAAWLRQRVEQAMGGWLDEEQVRTVRRIYGLWVANHDRHEELAARVDPEGYRIWAERAATARPGARRTGAGPTPRYRRDLDAQILGSGASMASASSSA